MKVNYVFFFLYKLSARYVNYPQPCARICADDRPVITRILNLSPRYFVQSKEFTVPGPGVFSIKRNCELWRKTITTLTYGGGSSVRKINYHFFFSRHAANTGLAHYQKANNNNTEKGIKKMSGREKKSLWNLIPLNCKICPGEYDCTYIEVVSLCN